MACKYSDASSLACIVCDTLVPSLQFLQYRVITVANMTELEGKNSLLGTDLVYKTDQQQLIQGTVRQETCTQENCITVERENYLGARDRFVS